MLERHGELVSGRRAAGTCDRNDLTKVRFSPELTGEPSAIEARPWGVMSLASAAACSAAFMRRPDEVFAPCVNAARSRGVSGVTGLAIRIGFGMLPVSMPWLWSQFR